MFWAFQRCVVWTGEAEGRPLVRVRRSHTWFSPWHGAVYQQDYHSVCWQAFKIKMTFLYFFFWWCLCVWHHKIWQSTFDLASSIFWLWSTTLQIFFLGPFSHSNMSTHTTRHTKHSELWVWYTRCESVANIAYSHYTHVKVAFIVAVGQLFKRPWSPNNCLPPLALVQMLHLYRSSCDYSPSGRWQTNT